MTFDGFADEDAIVKHEIESATTSLFKDTAAGIQMPVGMAIDKTNTNLYVAAAKSHKVFRIEIATGNVSDWLGTGRPGKCRGTRRIDRVASPSAVLAPAVKKRDPCAGISGEAGRRFLEMACFIFQRRREG